MKKEQEQQQMCDNVIKQKINSQKILYNKIGDDEA